MKPVAPNARVGKPARQCERLGEMRLAAMEGGVEACDLRNLRRDLHDGANRGEVVRLMKPRQRHKLREIVTTLSVTLTGASYLRPPWTTR